MNIKQRFVSWLIGKEANHFNGTGANFVLPTNLSNPDGVSVATTCVKILSETLGRMPLNVYREDKKGGRILDKKSPLWMPLHRAPNSYTNSNSFFQTVEYHRNSGGNGFAEIHRDENTGAPMWYEILSPSKVTGYKIRDNEVIYMVKAKEEGDDPREIGHMNMLHFKMTSPDGIWGINPIQALALNMSMTSKGMQSMDKFYENNALSPKAIKHIVGSANSKVGAEAMKTFKENYTGALNAGKWIDLPPNTEIQDLAISFADAQLIESLKFNSQQIAAFYGVPVYMATGDFTQSKYNNIEQSQLSFKINTVAPITRMYKAELEMKLLTEKDKRMGKEIEFNINSLVEPDTKTKSEYYAKLAAYGAITPKQIATLEGLPVTDDMDVHLVMTNLMSLEKYNKTPIKEA